MVAGSCEGDGKVKEEDDLKSWMHANGLPPCKVMLKEKPSHNPKYRPIHYVAASEDLQVLKFVIGFYILLLLILLLGLMSIVYWIGNYGSLVILLFQFQTHWLSRWRGYWATRLLVCCICLISKVFILV